MNDDEDDDGSGISALTVSFVSLILSVDTTDLCNVMLKIQYLMLV
jgi:hypothetical protein